MTGRAPGWLGTPFASRTEPLNGTTLWLQWFGYMVADAYTDMPSELRAIRERAAMNEMSPLQKYRISGPDAPAVLDRVMTRRVGAMEVGQVFYTPWCDDDGFVIGDGLLFRTGAEEYLLSGPKSLAWLSAQGAGADVRVDDVTAALGILALQGPRATDVLEAATAERWSELPFSRLHMTPLGGAEVMVARQGFTGEIGYELWVPAHAGPAVWDAIAEGGEPFGIQAAGEWAIDIARVEAGLLILGYDYTEAGIDGGQDGIRVDPDNLATPFELALGRFVEFDDRDFVGRAALERHAAAPRRLLVGLELDWRSLVRSIVDLDRLPLGLGRVSFYPLAVSRDGETVGRATSATWGGSIGKLIAFGHLAPAVAAAGSRLAVRWPLDPDTAIDVPATVVPLPFLPHRRR